MSQLSRRETEFNLNDIGTIDLSFIKAWREHLGLTQDELANRSGIKQPALARMEKPDANPRKSTLKKIADAMKITAEQLID
jgi:predicted transcriptional regulator